MRTSGPRSRSKGRCASSSSRWRSASSLHDDASITSSGSGRLLVDPLAQLAVALLERRPQAGMAIDQRLQGPAKGRQVERRADPRRVADVVRRAPRVHLVEEPQPALTVREREDRRRLLAFSCSSSRQQHALLGERQARQRLPDAEFVMALPAMTMAFLVQQARPGGHRPVRRRGHRCRRATRSAAPPGQSDVRRCDRRAGSLAACRCGRLRVRRLASRVSSRSARQLGQAATRWGCASAPRSAG